MNNAKIKKREQKIKEQYTDEMLVALEKDLSNFKFTIEKKDKAIEQFIKLLKLTKAEHQKLYIENKRLKKIENIEKITIA